MLCGGIHTPRLGRLTAKAVPDLNANRKNITEPISSDIHVCSKYFRNSTRMGSQALEEPFQQVASSSWLLGLVSLVNSLMRCLVCPGSFLMAIPLRTQNFSREFLSNSFPGNLAVHDVIILFTHSIAFLPAFDEGSNQHSVVRICKVGLRISQKYCGKLDFCCTECALLCLFIGRVTTILLHN